MEGVSAAVEVAVKKGCMGEVSVLSTVDMVVERRRGGGGV